MSEQASRPFFIDKTGEQQKSLYHSNLSRQSSLMAKFKQKPFDSKYPRAGTPGKIVYLELHDGFDYVYQIENEHIVGQLEQTEPDQWYNITARGKGEEATLSLSPREEVQAVLEEQREERAAIQEEPPLEPPPPTTTEPHDPRDGPVPPWERARSTPPEEKKPEPALAGIPGPGKPNPSTHIDCVAMTVETFKAFEHVGIGLDSSAVSKIYNTHFIALSKRGITR